MASQSIQHYDSPHQFEPLLPGAHVVAPLLEMASDLTTASARLPAGALAPHAGLRSLLRRMNSFYTNLIEGEHTRPSDIDRALVKNFSANPDVARRQRLALAHIGVEEQFESDVDATSADLKQQRVWLYAPETLCRIHGAMFASLPSEDLMLKDGSELQPGAIRTRQVAVGRHEAPLYSAVPAFLARWAEAYSSTPRGESTLLAIAASHHRLAWVHPFLDGNGRVARLHTHLALYSTGITRGFWSPLRGFARTQDRYRELLQAADEHRRGALDGRGNLSEKALTEWIAYVLQTCADQANFMAAMLDPGNMKDRIAGCLQFEQSVLKDGARIEALHPLHHLFLTGSEMSRAEFKGLSQLGDRQATQLVSDLIRIGYLKTSSAYGPVSFGIPPRALRFYFPRLWPEAEADEDKTPY